MKTNILLLTIFFLVCCQPLSARFNIDEFLRTRRNLTQWSIGPTEASAQESLRLIQVGLKVSGVLPARTARR